MFATIYFHLTYQLISRTDWIVDNVAFYGAMYL